MARDDLILELPYNFNCETINLRINGRSFSFVSTGDRTWVLNNPTNIEPAIGAYFWEDMLRHCGEFLEPSTIGKYMRNRNWHKVPYSVREAGRKVRFTYTEPTGKITDEDKDDLELPGGLFDSMGNLR